jgi:hypothetical protein
MAGISSDSAGVLSESDGPDILLEEKKYTWQ